MNPDLPPETREAPPGPVGLSVVARVLAPLVINHSTQIFLEEAAKKKITLNVKLKKFHSDYILYLIVSDILYDIKNIVQMTFQRITISSISLCCAVQNFFTT